MIARTVRIDRISKTTVVLTVVLALLSRAIAVGDARSVLFGGVVAAVNLHLIRFLVSRLMSPAAGPSLSLVVALKLLLLLTLLAIALKLLPIDVASFLVGGGALVVAIVLDAVLLGERAPAEDGTGAAPSR